MTLSAAFLRSRVLSVAASVFLGLIAPPRSESEPALPSKDRLRESPVLTHLRPNPIAAAPRTPAEETVAQMFLPEGFRATLVASEPDLHQPIAFAFDDRGRIWIAEAYSYPTKRAPGEGKDRIVIFEDSDGDGRFETRKVFIEGLNLVSGMEVGHGGVWVGAAPEMLFIPDRNQDDKPDGPPQVLLDGFGFQDTHECLNSFMWGPDGWLYGNQGVFNLAHIGKPGSSPEQRVELRAGVWRYHPTRHVFEVFAHGGSNPWGLDYDDQGQIFMTHCRSYFGRGCTTHVLPGGHFWNQANANYAPFIIPDPPQGFPQFKNYLLASARYDHGAGGAGAPGTDAIYGGHSHVGTMIYLGDNWPDELRGHLFTHNLGGHQMNHQIQRPLGSGFDTVHAGRDQMFCADPRYVPVDLQYGPDGAVYIIDWYDVQHCHNPNTERWDRSNGRLYRVEYAATYHPRSVNLGAMSDMDLVKQLSEKNRWFGRTARRLLEERAHQRPIDAQATAALRAQLTRGASSVERLNALWTLHATSDDVGAAAAARSALSDSAEFVRSWAVRLASENPGANTDLPNEVARLAREEASPVARLALASAIQRLPAAAAWEVIEALSLRGEDAEDRNIPALLWHGMAQRMPQDLGRAMGIARKTRIPQLADWAYWYAATLPGPGLQDFLDALSDARGDVLKRRLAGLVLALDSRANLDSPPASWAGVAARLYAETDVSLRRQAEMLGAAMGDRERFPELRRALADGRAPKSDRLHAFRVLSRALDPESLPTFLRLLDEADFRSPVLPVLGRYKDDRVATALIQGFERWGASEQQAALGTLSSRASFGVQLLDAIPAGKIQRDRVSAFYVRQLAALQNPDVDSRLKKLWGRLTQTSSEKLSKINQVSKMFDEAPLWAFDGQAGHAHFTKLCAPCHRLGEEGARIGPELTGAGRHGTRYLVENIIDPNAVIGADFQVTSIETKQGEVVSGLVVSRSADSVTLRTTVEPVVVAKSEIARETISENSLMPEGLLDGLSDREKVELLKFLREH